MSIAMFIVGFCIFAAYVGFLMWNIFYNHNKNREENYPGYYARHGQTDSMRKYNLNTSYPHDKVSRIKNKSLRQQEMYLSRAKDKKEDVN